MITAGANNVEPNASIMAVPHRTFSDGHGPDRASLTPVASAMNHMTQNVRDERRGQERDG